MEQIIAKDINELFEECLTKYALSVVYDRAFAGLDGLKVVQRRALYSMYDLGAKGASLKKTARITGDTIGRFQPHGDTSVAGAIALMANWFSQNYPLVKHKCNFGSMQGGGPASPRYTECAISDFALEVLFEELATSKNVVDWMPTYTQEEMEPVILPSKVPLLLINGSFGIGVGYKAEIPPHPLGDVIDQTIMLLRNPNHKVRLIPDQCMGCEVIGDNKTWEEIADTGQGSFTVRGRIDIDEMDGYPTLRIRSTPDLTCLDKGGDKGDIITKIEEMVEKKMLPMVYRMKEYSHGNDMDYRIILKKGSDPNYVKDLLYKNTQLKKTVSVCCIMTEDNEELKLHMFNYTQYLQMFISQRRQLKFRKYTALHSQKLTAARKLEAYINLMNRKDCMKIISSLRSATGGAEEIISMLINTYGMDDVQAKTLTYEGGIASLNVTELEKKKIQYENICRQLKDIMMMITDTKAMDQEIIDELLSIKKKYARPRHCTVINPKMSGLGPAGKFNVVITQNGYIKKFAETDTNIKPGKDTPRHVVPCDNRDNILLFTGQGTVYKVPVEKIPLVSGASNPGSTLPTFCPNIVSVVIFAIPQSVLAEAMESGKDLVVLSRNNCIKRMGIADIINSNNNSIIYSRVGKAGDSIVEVDLIDDSNDVIVYSDRKALRMPSSDIPKVSRMAAGNKAMDIDTEIDGLTVIHSSNEPNLVIITTPITGGKACKINKIITEALGRSSRAKGGSTVIRLGKDEIIRSIHACSDKDNINVITSTTFMSVKVASVPVLSTVSSGVRLNTNKGDVILRSWVVR